MKFIQIMSKDIKCLKMTAADGSKFILNFSNEIKKEPTNCVIYNNNQMLIRI